MSLTLPHGTQRLINMTYRKVQECEGDPAVIISEAIRKAHEIAIASASSRVLTIP